MRCLATALWNKAVETFVLAKVRAQGGKVRQFDRWALSSIHRLMLNRIVSLTDPVLPVAVEPAAGSGPQRAGVHNTSVLLAPFSAAWRIEAGAEVERLRASLSPDTEVLHIGSTAVPGLAAKPIIDLALVLRAKNFPESFAETQRLLAAAGYRYLGVRGGYFFEKAKDRVRTHALQVHRAGSPELGELLRFRDALRENPALRSDYERVKAKLAAHFPGRRLLYVTFKFHWIAEWQWRSAGAPDWADWFVQHKLSQFRLAAQASART